MLGGLCSVRFNQSLSATAGSDWVAIILSISLAIFVVHLLILYSRCERNFATKARLILTMVHLAVAMFLAAATNELLLASYPLLWMVVVESLSQLLAFSTQRSTIAEFEKRAYSSSAVAIRLRDPELNDAVKLGEKDPNCIENFRELVAEPLESDLEEDETEFDPNCLLQMSRYRSAGKECISGQASVLFSATDQVQVLHIAFCPPFVQLPHMEIFQIAGPAVRITQTMLEKFGMRIELKRLSKPGSFAETANVGIEFIAESKGAVAA
jgi:hypothetical protein